MVPEIKTVCFIGAGTMGCYNSLISALAGYQVVLYDRDPSYLEAVAGAHQGIAAQLSQHLGLSDEMVSDAFGRVTTEADLGMALANADLVSESIVEVLDIKRSVQKQLDELAKPSAIVTTNTSNLLISDIASAVSNGHRFAALHSYLGAPLIDVVGGPDTSDKTIDVLQRYVTSLGCMPMVLKKEYPGYVLNALLAPLLSTSIAMVVNGVAEPSQIDKAWQHFMSAPMGPFGMMDMFGLNLIADSWTHKNVQDAELALKERVVDYLSGFVSRGELGVKSGKGFYTYPEPAFQSANFLEGAEQLEAFANILKIAILGSACKIAIADVASVADIDKCWQVGTTLAKGPFSDIKEKGTAAEISMLTEIQEMTNMYGQEEFLAIVDFIKTEFAS